MLSTPVDSEEEFEGEVKSFSAAHGYGFVGCEPLYQKYERDVYIQQPVYGDANLGIGDRIVFRVKVRRGKPKCHVVVKRLVAAHQPVAAVEVRRDLGDLKALEASVLEKRFLRACASAKAESVGDVEQLLEAGANPNARDVTDQLALMVCSLNVRHGERKCRILVEHKADPGAMANETQTVIAWAENASTRSLPRSWKPSRKGRPLMSTSR